MSRRRSISTDISTDPKLAELAEHGPLPCLLYTWAIPHADDWGRLTGDARQFKLLICPGLDVTAKDVDDAIDRIAAADLWARYEVDGRKYIAFPIETWWRHQSYIPASKRDQDKSAFPAPPGYMKPQNAADHRRSPQNTSSPSPSPSPTLTPSPSIEEKVNSNGKGDEGADAPGGDVVPFSLCGELAKAAGLTASVDKLQHLIAQHPKLTRDRLIFEAEMAAEWIADPAQNKGGKRKMSTRFLHNWFTRAEERPALRPLKATGTHDAMPRYSPPEPKPLPDVRGLAANVKPVKLDAAIQPA